MQDIYVQFFFQATEFEFMRFKQVQAKQEQERLLGSKAKT